MVIIVFVVVFVIVKWFIGWICSQVGINMPDLVQGCIAFLVALGFGWGGYSYDGYRRA